jgi:hypothetical protein
MSFILNANGTLLYLPKQHFPVNRSIPEQKNINISDYDILYNNISQEIIEMEKKVFKFSSELDNIKMRLQDIISSNANQTRESDCQQDYLSTDDEAEDSTVDDKKSESSSDEPYEF